MNLIILSGGFGTRLKKINYLKPTTHLRSQKNVKVRCNL